MASLGSLTSFHRLLSTDRLPPIALKGETSSIVLHQDDGCGRAFPGNLQPPAHKDSQPCRPPPPTRW